jgi:hypothetical protein
MPDSAITWRRTFPECEPGTDGVAMADGRVIGRVRLMSELPATSKARIAKKFAAQRTSVRVLEISGAAMALAVGLFGASLVASPARTEASTFAMTQIDPVQMTVNAPRDLPSFDDTYQRHLGVLDTLRH